MRATMTTKHSTTTADTLKGHVALTLHSQSRSSQSRFLFLPFLPSLSKTIPAYPSSPTLLTRQELHTC
jgi:hypothetical protein